MKKTVSMAWMLFVFCLILITMIFLTKNQESTKPAKQPDFSEIEHLSYTPLSLDINLLEWQEDPHLAAPLSASLSSSRKTLRLALNKAFFTLRTEGQGADFQESHFIEALLYQSLLKPHFLQNKPQTDESPLGLAPLLSIAWARKNSSVYFRINPKARWADGTPVTAWDVYATWKFLQDPQLEWPEKSSAFSAMKLEVHDPLLLSVKFEEHLFHQHFIRFVTQSIFSQKELMFLNGQNYRQLYQNTVLLGSGPYLYQSGQSDKEKKLIFKKNPHYWATETSSALPSEAQGYPFEEIILYVIPQRLQRQNSLLRGEIDLLKVTSAQEWTQEWPQILQQFPGRFYQLKVDNQQAQGISGLAFNTQDALLSDLRLREALDLLWNRSFLLKNYFYDEYIASPCFFPQSPYCHPQSRATEYNPQRARRLLEEAAWTKNKQGLWTREGQFLEFTILASQNQAEFLHPYKVDLQKEGISLEIQILPYNILQTRIFERNFQIAFTGFHGSYFPPVEDFFASWNAEKKGSLNIWGIKDSILDQNLIKLRSLSTWKAQQEEIMQIDKRLSELKLFAYAWYSDYNARFILRHDLKTPQDPLGTWGNESALFQLWWWQ